MNQRRNTVQKRAVLETVRAIKGHPTAADVFAEVRARHPRVSLATVYRVLHSLAAQGDLLEVRIGTVSLFDAGTLPHHHIVCRVCGAVTDVCQPLPRTLLHAVERSSGYQVESGPIQFSGVCPLCIAPARTEALPAA